MNRIILASHGGMSAGMKDTVEMILGELPNLYAVATTRDETESILETVRRLLAGFAPEDRVYILTDVLGGSVNNHMLMLLRERPDLTIICGMNICLAINLATSAAPAIIGIESKKEILAPAARLKPSSKAAVIVAPERDTPGIIAKACAQPISIKAASGK